MFAEGAKSGDSELINIAKLRARYWYHNSRENVRAENRPVAEKRLLELASLQDQLAPGAQGPAASRTPTKSASSAKVGGMYGSGKYSTKLADNNTGSYASSAAFTQEPNPLASSTTAGFGMLAYGG